jgi:agmatine deiminase
MPAEWEPHERTIMAFPTPQPWLRNVAAARQEWAAVAQAVAEFEPVLMVANQSEGKIAEMLCGTRRVSVVELPLDSAWTRDTGPLFLTDGKGKRRAVGFTFNGWGDVQPHERDALLKARLCDWLRTEMYAAPLVLEGGGITVDGEGTLISTEECLLNANRNPGVSREALEKQLGDYLGVEKVVWLGQGLKPDPVTDGHVDGLCVFVRPGVVMLHTTDVESDPNHALCRDARERLLAAKDAKGRALEVIELPLGGRDVAHINFYLCNGAVVVPTTGDKKLDDAPLARIREAFPERKVVGVKALAIAQGGGGVHCITQQVPAKG